MGPQATPTHNRTSAPSPTHTPHRRPPPLSPSPPEQLATGTPVQSGSWVVNCAPTPNDNNNGIIFFCQDTACASCSSQFAFNNSGTSDSKLQCIDLPNAGSNTSTGSRSFQAQCDTGSRQKDAEEEEQQQNGAAASVAASLATAAGTLAAALLMMA
jgi:hypothetical protein